MGSKAATVTQVLCSERHDAVQGKTRHQAAEECKVITVVRISFVVARKGECQAWSERRIGQGGWVKLMHLDADIRHSPRMQVHVAVIVAYEHALPRLGVLSPVDVSRNIRKKFSHIIAIRKQIADCFEAQLGEDW